MRRLNESKKVKSENMKDVRLFANIASTIPIFWLTSFLISLLVGTLYVGHIPIYGVDRDPYSINSFIFNTFYFINFVITIIGFIAVPAYVLLTAHLLINKIKFTKKELAIHIISLFSLIVLLFFRFLWSSQLDCVYD